MAMLDLDRVQTHIDYLRRLGRSKLAEDVSTLVAHFRGESHVHRCACGATWDEDAALTEGGAE